MQTITPPFANPRASALLEQFLSVADEALQEVKEQGVRAFTEGDLGQVPALAQDAQAITDLIASLRSLAAPVVAAPPIVEEAPQPAEPELAVIEIEEPAPVEPPAEPEPVAAAQVVPEPEAPPRPKPQPKIAGHVVNRWRTDFRQECAGFEDLPLLTGPDQCRFKSTVCLGRALEEIEPLYTDEILRLRHHWNTQTREASFFGFNLNRNLSPEAWIELRDVYRCLAEAIDASEWLCDHEENVDATWKMILTQAASADAWLHRIIDRGLGIIDFQQSNLHDRLSSLARERGVFVDAWKAEINGGPRTESIVRDAKLLAESLARAKKGRANVARQQEAMSELGALIYTSSAESDFAERLVQLAVDCLEAGIAPSRKPLTEILVPYRQTLADADDPRLAKLIQYIDKSSLDLIARHRGIPEPEDASEGDSKQLAELKQKLAGKRVLFVGGNKGQEKRRVQIEKALGLAALVWPDLEDKDGPSKVESSVVSADLVCQLIRFSRHSYKQAIDYARSLGKETAILPRGLGFNTIVHDLHNQLCRPPR